jgi:hypothetical protein
VNDAAALFFARGGDFLTVFDKPQREAFAMLFLRLHHQGVLANEIFWGLWLLPFGLLVYRSRFLPRILGVWLMAGCFGYLALSFTGLLFPRYEDKVFTYAQPLHNGRGGNHAVAHDHGRQTTSGGRRNLVVGGLGFELPW